MALATCTRESWTTSSWAGGMLPTFHKNQLTIPFERFQRFRTLVLMLMVVSSCVLFFVGVGG